MTVCAASFTISFLEKVNNVADFNLATEAIRMPYTPEVAAFCKPFSCKDNDLDDFFANISLYYNSEMLGRTYVWVKKSDPKNILGMVTLANDSVKLKLIAKSALNRLQRSITNAKRGMNYPAVLIGRLGVASEYQGRGMRIGSQILDYIKGWFRSEDNKTGCRFIVVDAYNNPKTINFYENNGFKPLYKSEEEERAFLELEPDEPLETRFMFFDLKLG